MKSKSINKPHLILKKAFERQRRQNPSFSLRSLALKIGISPSYVSRILNGKKPLPENRFNDMTHALGMDGTSCRYLREALLSMIINKRKESALVLSEILSTKVSYKESPLHNYEEASLNEFQIFDPWYRMAILDLVTCINFNPDPAWISQKLTITPYQAQEGLDILIKNGLVEIKNEKYIKKQEKLRLPTTRSHIIIRKYHKKMIEKSLQILLTETDDKAFNKRFINSISIAANPTNLAKAKQRLYEALHEVANILSEGECTEVYQLNTQLFSLTR